MMEGNETLAELKKDLLQVEQAKNLPGVTPQILAIFNNTTATIKKKIKEQYPEAAREMGLLDTEKTLDDLLSELKTLHVALGLPGVDLIERRIYLQTIDKINSIIKEKYPDKAKELGIGEDE